MAGSGGSAPTRLRERQGQPREVLAPESLYIQHSRWGTGSSLDENLECLSENVCLTRATFPQAGCPRGIVQFATWSSEWKKEAKSYQVKEWFDLNGDFDLLCTALQYGFACVIGLNWPGGGGHSVLATDIVHVSDGWCVEGPNSWGVNSGNKGFYRLTERQLSSLDSYGCWAARSCVYSDV